MPIFLYLFHWLDQVRKRLINKDLYDSIQSDLRRMVYAKRSGSESPAEMNIRMIIDFKQKHAQTTRVIEYFDRHWEPKRGAFRFCL